MPSHSITPLGPDVHPSVIGGGTWSLNEQLENGYQFSGKDNSKEIPGKQGRFMIEQNAGQLFGSAAFEERCLCHLPFQPSGHLQCTQCRDQGITIIIILENPSRWLG